MALIEYNSKGEETGYARIDVRISTQALQALEDIAEELQTPYSGKSGKRQIGLIASECLEKGLAQYLAQKKSHSYQNPKEVELIEVLKNATPALKEALRGIIFKDNQPIELTPEPDQDAIEEDKHSQLELELGIKKPLVKEIKPEKKRFDFSQLTDEQKTKAYLDTELKELLISVKTGNKELSDDTYLSAMSKYRAKPDRETILTNARSWIAEVLRYFDLTPTDKTHWEYIGSDKPIEDNLKVAEV